MRSGAAWAVTPADILIALALLLLFGEVLKATRLSRRSIVDHLLSSLLFVAMLAEFLLVRQGANGTFFLLLVTSFVDLGGGISIAVSTARGEARVAARGPIAAAAPPQPAEAIAPAMPATPVAPTEAAEAKPAVAPLLATQAEDAAPSAPAEVEKSLEAMPFEAKSLHAESLEAELFETTSIDKVEPADVDKAPDPAEPTEPTASAEPATTVTPAS
jgi:hypothetical protein